MIGPASKRHFMKALQLASQAEREIVPGALMNRGLMALTHAVIEIIRGIAFAFIHDEVEVKATEGDRA